MGKMRIAIKKKQKIYNECSFYPSTKDFLDLHIAGIKGYYETKVINLKELNKILSKTRTRGAYATSQLSNVREQILNAPVVEVVEKLGTWAYRIKILPFDDVQKIEKIDENLNAQDVADDTQKQDSETDTELVAEDEGIDQQQLIYANQKARSLGIDFGLKGLRIIAQYPKEILDRVIAHYQFAKERTHIPSPTGWIIRNLKEKWYKNFDCTKHIRSIE
jgi:hypothetical protein